MEIAMAVMASGDWIVVVGTAVLASIVCWLLDSTGGRW